MATARSSTTVLALGVLLMTLVGECYGNLQVGYYNKKCGTVNVEAIVFWTVKKHYMKEKDTVSDLVRLQFHDCWVRGCDASILLEGKDTEKTAPPNGSVAGFDIIEEAKSEIEKYCPGVVSCADIVIMAARSAVYLGGAYWYDVETGRKDGHISKASEALRLLPGPDTPIPVAVNLFAKKGINKEEFVVLLGCHTVGTAHCDNFEYRLYNYRGTGKSDPTINPSFLSTLRSKCPRNMNSHNEAFLDQTPGSMFTMDNAFFKAILAGKGVLEIDQQMAVDSSTKGIVQALASNPKMFASKIGPAMVKLGRVDVTLNGSVRKGTCRHW